MRTSTIGVGLAAAALALGGCGGTGKELAADQKTGASTPAALTIRPWNDEVAGDLREALREANDGDVAKIDLKTVYEALVVDCRGNSHALKSAFKRAATGGGSPKWIAAGMGVVCPDRADEAVSDRDAVAALDPDPEGTYESNCSYQLGDFSNYTSHGYRFTADARMHNTGNIGTVNKITVVWHLSGGGKVTKTTTAKVAAGTHKLVSISVPTDGDKIGAYQDLDNSIGNACKVTVAMVDTFGEVQ